KGTLTRVRAAKARAAERDKRKNVIQRIPWIIDSGSNRVMTYSKDVFISGTYKSFTDTQLESIELGDGSIILAYGTGDVMLGPNFIVKNALYVPKLTENLLPTRIPGRKGLYFSFEDDICDVLQGHQLLATARYDEDFGLHVLYQTLFQPHQTSMQVPSHAFSSKRPYRTYAEALKATSLSTPSPSKPHLRPIELRKEEARVLLLNWHQGLGHCSLTRLKQMAINNMV
ncbi:MAG: hypothetical protein ACE3JU_11600, partial [Paenibacillus sp.]|uniref:hypothetical protein n=1 Tax=Paenibacillus sp. TaxID=58172 RepID=UPI003B760B75